MKLTIAIFLLGIVFRIPRVSSLPTGAPLAACETITPSHGSNLPQNGPSPYQVTATAEQGNIRVSVRSADALTFRGVILQARLENGQLGGNFVEVDENAYHHLNCQEGSDSTLTHNSNNNKQQLQTLWEPPSGYTGSVIFNSSVVQVFNTLWVGIESAALKIN